MSVRVSFVFLLLGAFGCEDTGLGAGEACVRSADCAQVLCLNNRCVSPEGDEDGDGLSNAVEQGLNSDPLSRDSDGDGAPDGVEAPGGEATDSDGDGIPDIFEHRLADGDRDCLPDQLDADHVTPTDDPGAIRAAHCRAIGVCAGAQVTATCEDGVARCTYDSADFETSEVRCDGLDNDCDGLTDEGSRLDGEPVGGPCDGGGVCGAGLVECAPDGGVRCSSGPGGSGSAVEPERCNGLDDDCDGHTDEGLLLGDGGPAVGSPCPGQGLCAPGVVECAGGEIVCSTLPGGSAWVEVAERCNGLDDDCDGDTDEDFAAGGLPVGADCGQGVCAGGIVTCTADGSAAGCSTDDQRLDLELCNGADDNCNGVVDEAEALDPGMSGCPSAGVCAGEDAVLAVCAGKWACEPGPASAWTPGEETSCDGLDNDCDGDTDEGFGYTPPDGETLPVGTSCGLGACAGGQVTCSSDGKAAICTTAAQVALEVCDLVDNDCDGDTDEAQSWKGLSLGAPCAGTGACGDGVVSCNPATGKATCSTNPGGVDSEAHPEACNGLDDDCDGETDELDDVLGAITNCAAPGICAGGGGSPTGCEDAALVCDLSTVPGYEGPAELTCDGLDNDCDGLSDELLPKQPAPGGFVTFEDGTPAPRLEMVAALVPAGGEVILVGGDSTVPVAGGLLPNPLADVWRFDLADQSWRQQPGQAPPPRAGAALAAGPGGGVVLIGGQSTEGSLLSEVWRLPASCEGCDPAAWTQLFPEGTFTPRRGHAVATDAASGWIWVVGGRSETGGKALTALDLSGPPKWVPSLPAGPGWREGVAAALLPSDESAGGPGARLIAHGGQTEDGLLKGDLWVLDIAAKGWTPFDAADEAPPPRRDHAMTVHGQTIYLYGGTGAMGAPLGDLWVLDPKLLEWEQVSTSLAPPPRSGAALLADGDGLLLLGGSASGEALGDAWRFSPAPKPTWTALATDPVPPQRTGAGLFAIGPGRLLLTGGVHRGTDSAWASGDVWERDGEIWIQRSTGAPARAGAARAWDASGGRLLMHGGFSQPHPPTGEPASNQLDALAGDTWTTDLGGDLPLPALAWHGAAWDPIDDRLVLYGGVGAADAPPAADLWAVDPSTGLATGVTTTGAPPALLGPVLYALSEPHELVLAGGEGGSGGVYVLDRATAEWVTLATVPGSDVRRPVSFLDAPTRALYLVGNDALHRVDLSTGASSEIAAPGPLPAPGAAAVFDPLLGRVTTFGGDGPSGYTLDAIHTLSFTCP